MTWADPSEFGVWFVETFITPLLDVLYNHRLLGVSLYGWLFATLALDLGVSFYNAFFGIKNEKR